MLGPIRKFSTTIYAKILLAIIVIPFVFWGMGSTFFGGNKNIVLTINKDKHSIQQFYDFINRTATKKVKINEIENYLSGFISEKLIEKEIKNYGILLSDKSLSKLIKNQKGFKRDNKFSRTEYEKFLLKNNVTTLSFESILREQEKKRQLLSFISGGVIPANFLINKSYDQINQQRNIELINLTTVFNKSLNFSENQIKTYFEKNKEKYSEIYKTINILEINPKNLVDDDEFNDLFFKKVDEIDDMLIISENFDTIVKKFDLPNPDLNVINALGNNIKNNKAKNISQEIAKKIFSFDENNKISLIEIKNKYYVVEVLESKNIIKDINDQSIRNKILLNLSSETKRKLSSEIISKINKEAFSKLDFNKLSKDEAVSIEKIKINNQNDDEFLKKEIVYQIYQYPEKRIILVNDLNFTEVYLIYVDKVQNVKINENSKDFSEYFKLSQAKIVNELYNTYDSYIKSKYKIDINYQALDVVKNYFN